MLFDPKKPWIFYDADGTPSGGAADAGGQEAEDQDATKESEADTEEENEDLKLDGEYDQERAKRTIKAQRDSEARIKAELAKANKALAGYQKAEQEALDAKKTELEKLTERNETLQNQLTQAQEAIQGMRLERAFMDMAVELELSFASTQAASDAFDLVDLDGVKVDENGKVTGLKPAVKKLKESRPYLFTEEKPGLGTPVKKKVPGTPPASENGKTKESYPSLAKL